MSTSPNSAFARHAWLDDFIAEPTAELTRLLAGRAQIYPYTRADAVDAARMLFGGLEPEDPARNALSGAILDWLHRARLTAISINPAVQQNQIQQVVNAFEIIGALRLLDAAERLRREYIRWRSWVDNLVIGPARDGRAAYLRMLASTQIVLEERFANPDGLAPLWTRLCVEAGGALPNNYLQIGLVGLRKLPLALQRGDTPWLAGLAEWALSTNPSPAEFLAVWRPLKRLYPSSHAVLRKQVYSLLSQPTFRDAEIDPPGWWRADPEFPPAQQRGTVSFEPPPKEMREGLLDSIAQGKPFRMIEPRLAQLVQLHRIYATRSGESDYLVRTFCNVGFKLIEHGTDARVARGERAEALAREALNHEPFNIYAWSLWRDALAARGAYSDARDLGWEIIRRFPNDPLPRNLLGELLVSGGEISEAFRIVSQTVEDDLANEVTYMLLARVEASQGRLPQAEAAIRAGLEIQPHNQHLLAALSRLRAGNGLGLHSSHFENLEDGTLAEGDAAQEMSIRNGRLRALRDQIRGDRASLSVLRSILDEDPNFVYAQILGARHHVWEAKENVLPPVAAAFEAALADEDRATLEALTLRAPRLKALIHLARALFGDEESAQYITELLNHEDQRSLVEGERILKFRLGPVRRLIDEGTPPVDAIRTHRSRVLHALYDANEALAAPEVLAA